jgi:carotenoid cleavage dioxygenase-like enzyme
VQVDVHARFESALPVADTHPYRTGVWRPQTVEYDAWDLDVDGEIPDDLNGVYLRNTENPLLPPIKRYHPFDGDGMLHAMSFEAGEAMYRNRFVRTRGFEAERRAGRSLWAGIAEHPGTAIAAEGWGARTAMKDSSSTDVVVHGGMALTSFYQCGQLYQLDPLTLEQHGPVDWEGRFPDEGVSAHPKIDENTGEMLFFNYSTDAPYMHYGIVSPEGRLDHYIDVPLPGPRLPHDMAFTENYAIVNDCPLFWDPESLADGYYATRFHPDLPTRFGVIPRGGASDEIVWFEAEPTFVLHWTNAYEDGDEIVLDGFFEHDPWPTPRPGADPDDHMLRFLDMYTLQAKAHRWRFDLTTGRTSEEQLSDTILEFPMINGRHGGRRHRYSYNALPVEGWFGFRGVVKHDVETGTEETLELPGGQFASETVMAPRDGAQAEDDGYLLTFVSDVSADRSECLVLDAAQPSAGPIARVRLPERISSGTHAYWAPAEYLI